jgi:cytidylate kinase
VSGSVIAIDGPAGAGKSTTARAVAEALGFAHLDSGALYRGVTLVALREASRQGRSGASAVELVDPETVLRVAEDWGLMLQPDGHGFSAYLQGEPVDDAIRGPEVTAQVSAVAAVPIVREWVNIRLRAMVRAGMNVVVDGRDIGTVVFPDADLKVFLTAASGARAARRLLQRGRSAEGGALEREEALLAARDRADSSRAVAPLRRPPDAVDVDTTDLSFEEQVDHIAALARSRLGLEGTRS